MDKVQEQSGYENTPEWRGYCKLMEERPKSFRGGGYPKIVTDVSVVDRFVRENHVKIGLIYQSPYNTFLVDLVEEKDGFLHTYDRLLGTVGEGAVVTVPIFEHQFVLIRQFRHSVQDFVWAFPRGFGEKDISPEENVAKELSEEIGARQVSKVQKIGTIAPDTGILGVYVDAYVCEVSNVELRKDHEGIEEVMLVSEEQLQMMIQEQKLVDGYTLAGYAMYQQQK